MNRILIILFLSPFFLVAQDRIVDSLKLKLKMAKHDTTRCNILNALTETADDKEWPLFNDQLLKLAEKNSQTANAQLKSIYLNHLAAAINNLGFIARQEGDIPKAIDYFLQSLKIQEEIKNQKGIALTLNNIGAIYKGQGDIAKAMEYYQKSLKIKEEINDKKGIATSLNNIAEIYNFQGDITKSIEYYYKSLKIEEEIGNKKGIASSFHNIGFMYGNQGDLTKALEYYTKSLKIKEEINDKMGIAYSLNNIGNVYERKGDLQLCLKYMNQSLKIREEMNDKTGIATALHNIGYIYDKQNNNQEALTIFYKSLKIFEELKDKQWIAFTTNKISLVLLEEGKVMEANNYAIASMHTAKELGYPLNILRAANALNKIYKKQNKFKEALAMYELEIQMRDSISNAETKKASIKKQFQYQYEKKAAADSVKNAEEQKVKNALLTAQKAQLKQEKTQRFALYGGLVLVIAFLGFVFNRFRVTQKQKLIIEQQKTQVDVAFAHLEEKNREVMDSIMYARRIQRALLTPEKYIEKQLNKLTNNNNKN